MTISASGTSRNQKNRRFSTKSRAKACRQSVVAANARSSDADQDTLRLLHIRARKRRAGLDKRILTNGLAITREECEEVVVFMIRNRSPWCAGIARGELEDLLGKTKD